jgi:hypothetical protein
MLALMCLMQLIGDAAAHLAQLLFGLAQRFAHGIGDLAIDLSRIDVGVLSRGRKASLAQLVSAIEGGQRVLRPALGQRFDFVLEPLHGRVITAPRGIDQRRRFLRERTISCLVMPDPKRRQRRHRG